MATAGRRQDPIGALADVLAAIDGEAKRQGSRLARNEHNRIGLLIVHAIVALIVAPLFMATAGAFVGPTWDLLKQIPGFPASFIAPLWVGGMILLPATFGRRAGWEIAGLALIYLWYLAMAVGFAFPVINWLIDAAAAARDGKPQPPHKPSLYAPVVYAHLAVIMRVHIFTLVRIRRERAASANGRRTP
jgi:hypothetical protein